MNKLWSVSQRLFSRHLLATNTVACGSLMAVGDCFTQYIERLDDPGRQFNYKRTGRMFCVGCLLGPFSHVWYKLLDKYLPGATFTTVGKKILSDQIVAGPFFCSAFFMGMSIMEGKPLDEGVSEVKEKFLTVYLIDWCVWPPAQFINFFFLPTKFRVVYVSTITLFWNTFLSWMKHKEHNASTVVK